MKLQTNRYRN